jgi:hypothetical protein
MEYTQRKEMTKEQVSEQFYYSGACRGKKAHRR